MNLNLNLIITAIRYFVLSIFCVFSVQITTLAQTGPGGVGNSDGSGGQPANVIWYAADNLSLSDTDPVSSLSDLSGNGNDASQGTAAEQPLYRTGQVNGLPAIVFDGSDDFIPFDGSLITNSDYTVIFVGGRQSNSSQRVFMGGTTASSNQNLHLYWNNSTQFRAHHYGNDLQTDMVANTEAYSSGTDATEYGIFATLLSSTESSNQRRNYQNNSYLGARSNSTQLSSYSGAAFGRYRTNFHNVNLAEVIIYSNALNDAQLQIVYEFLGEKYGITIDNDLYAPSAAYNYDIIGVGEEANGEHSNANNAGLYLSALSGLGVGDYVFASHNNATNNSSTFRTDAEITASGAEEAYNRIWYIEEVATPAVQISFDFSEALTDGLNPTNISNYSLLYRSGTSGNFTKVKNADGLQNGDQIYFNLTDVELADGYYTLATDDATNSPLEGIAGRTWYSMISGDWDDWETWTLDPSGALPNNPDNYTPTTSPTNTADKVVILTGRTVTVATNTKVHSEVLIDGRLDIQSTTGHSFGLINGSGRILLSADNFPSGDASDFVTAGQGEGTVEYYGGSYTLSTGREFYDVEIELSASTNTITLLNDYTINGDLRVNTGILKINDDASTTILNLSVADDVTVESTGNITTGLGDTRSAYQIGATMPADDGKLYHDIYHQFTINGDFTNRGTVRFTNLDAPDYNSLATDGAVTVRFEGSSDASVNLYNTTDFYNLVVEKGSDKTYGVNIYSDNTSYFTLYGANNVGRTTGAPFSSEDPQIRKALFVHKGTLQLRGNIHIPSLSEGNQEGGNGDYTIGQNARFWMNGSNVTVYSTASDVDQVPGFTSGDTYTADGVTTGSSNQAMSVYGEFKISDGYFGTRNSAGFIFWAASYGQLSIDGGTCYVAQVRSSSSGSGIASYVQTGGTMQVFGNEASYGGEYNGNYPLFGLETSDAVFQMSGGDILLQDMDNDEDPEFYINSDEGRYNVTGGTVTFDLPDGDTAQIHSTANLWNLTLTNSSSTGTMGLRQLRELTVMRDLYLSNYTQLNSDGFDLKIGDDWEFRDGAEYLHGGNTVSFIGNRSSYIYVRNTTNVHELVLNNVTLDANQRRDNTNYRNVNIRSGGGRSTSDSPLLIEGDLTIERGEFDVNRWEIDLLGSITIVDGNIIETDTPDGKIVLKSTTAQQTIEGSHNDEQEFGWLELDNSFGAKLLSNINVTKFELTQGIMDLDIYNLDVSDSLLANAAYSSTLMYKTAGNPSDGGITRYIDFSTGSVNNETLFPFGTGTSYTPARVIQVTTTTDAGQFTINPVADYHPATTDNSKTIPYYWTVDTSGFSTLAYTDVQYTFTYPGSMPASINKGSNLWDQDYQWYEHNNVKSGSDIEFPAGAYLTEDFTLGNKSVFNAPTIYYSRVSSGNWSSGTSWSTDSYDGAAAGSTPSSYDIVKIGYSGSPGSYTRHRITLDVGTAAVPTEIAGLVLEQNPEAGAVETNMSRLIIPPTTGLQVNGKISGDGEIQFQIDGTDVPTLDGDMGDFVNTEGASFIMRSNNGNVTAPTNLTRFPRLSIPGASNSYDASRSVTFTTDIYCHTLNVRYGGTLLLNNGADGDIDIRDSLRIGGIGTDNEGRIIYQNNGAARTITVGTDLIFDTDGTTYDNNQLYVETGGTDNLEHNLDVNGNIVLRDPNSLLDLFTANDGAQSNVILNLIGTDNGDFTDANNTVPELYRVVLDKDGAGTPRFDFDDAVSINGPSDGDPKAIELVSGILDLNDAGIDVTLSSGGADFKIPQGTQLHAGRATLRVSGDNTGIWLDGRIRIGYNSKWYINEGTNNYIEYTSSGESEIDIHQGELYVGSQIRRSTIAEEGILEISQNHSNSTVVIGTNADQGGEPTRGVLELVNTGSYFRQVADAKITIANNVPNSTTPSLYLNLDAAEISLADNSTIAFGGSDTETSQNLTVYSNRDLRNIEVDNTSANNPTLTLATVGLTADTVSINSGATFDANGLNLYLNGNFRVDGTFTSNQNTTYFQGTGNQSIYGSPTFYNLYKNTANALTINNDVTVENETHLESGTFIDGGNTLTAKGNTWMDITHTYGGAGDGILLNGTSQQTLIGNGIFGRLSINNSQGVTLPSGNAFTISDDLQLITGIFDIGKNLLTINESATITETNAFSENNMIQTNVSFTDAGIKKFFPAIASSTTFTYPLGSTGKYTPVEFTISSKNAGGFIRVKAADEAHPTIQNDTEPCNELTDSLNVLSYHWLVEASSITGFTATATMQFYPEDIQLNTSDYDITHYIGARLLWGSTLWDKYDQSSFDEVNNQLRFTFTNTDDNGISGDYTAGIEDQGGTCEGAIPDEVATYITIADGNWTDASIWDTYPVGGGTVPAGGPRGAAVIIEHDVTIPSNYIVGYKTTINLTGTVRVGSTFGHRLGIVDGQGTLQLERGDLPAGIYDDFFGTNGGTIEFSGTDDYDVLSEIIHVNNLSFTGTGERRLPNLDLLVYGLFEIAGDDATLQVINEHDRDLTLDSNVVFTQGTFDAGIGTSTVTMNGSFAQTITGDFTGGNAFMNFEMNNTLGVTLLGDVEIDGTLDFTTGVITTSAANLLTLNNSSETAVTGYSSSNYVDGPMQKFIIDGDDFVFPVGDASRYGQIEVLGTSTSGSSYWEAEYYNSNPHPTYDTSSYASPITIVSGNEYWRVKGPASGQSHVRVTWDDQSLLPAISSNRNNNLHIAEWIAGNSRWESVGDNVTDNGVNDGTIQTDAVVDLDEHYFTIATDEANPQSAAAFTSTDVTICEGQSTTLSVNLSGTANWSLTITEGGDSHTFTGITSSPFTFSVDSAGTYSITAVSDIYGAGVPYGSDVTVTVEAYPDNSLAVSDDNVCEGADGTITITNAVSGVSYQARTEPGDVAVGSSALGAGADLDLIIPTASLNTGANTFNVYASSASGCATELTDISTVTEYNIPTPVITGTDSTCNGTTLIYSTTAGMSNYVWTVDPGYGTITAGSGTNSITVDWINYRSLGSPLQISVTYDNGGCVPASDGTLDVMIFKIPESGPANHIENSWAN